jgi:hypothetical protein
MRKTVHLRIRITEEQSKKLEGQNLLRVLGWFSQL